MTDRPLLSGVYGAPPPDLAPPPPGAQQLSPLYPGAHDLEAAAPGSFGRIVMLAPPGTVERRAVLAQALMALAPVGEFVVLAAKDKGGLRLGKDLAGFRCAVAETSKSHHRICVVTRPAAPLGLTEAIQAGAARVVEANGLWSQPGVFSWDRLDPGSRILGARLPRFRGAGADLGCGIGILSLVVLGSPEVQSLDLIDLDRRAIAAARRNIVDPRAQFHWADVAKGEAGPRLDFVVMNPPFHHAAMENKALGLAFIQAAAKRLRSGGVCWLVANRHLPYEAALAAAFKSVRLDYEADGFKVFEAKA